MIVALAFCPSPPVLVPEIAAGASVELAGLRLACEAGVTALLDERPDEVVVVGTGPASREHSGDAAGTFSGYGVDLRVGGAGPVDLPLSLAVGAWLLDRAGCRVPRTYVEVAVVASADEAGATGLALATRAARTALLVMGDGSAGRTPKSPGTYDPGAERYDAAIATALARGDAMALTGLDAAEAARLQVSGRAAWQVASAAARALGEPVTADLLADEAPYGVGYFVATWLPTVVSSESI